MRLTLRERLVMLMAAAIVPLCGLAMVNAWLNEKEAIERTRADLKFAATLVAAQQRQMIDSTRHLLEAIMNAPGLANGTSADCQTYLATLQKRLPMYANLGFVGLDGHVTCHGRDAGAFAFVGDRDYFQETLTRRRFTVGGYKVGRLHGRQVMTFSMPVMDSGQKVTALAMVAVDLEAMSKAVGAVPLPEGSRVAVLDRQGIVLAAHPPWPAFIGRHVPTALLRKAINIQDGGVDEGLDIQGRERLFAVMPVGTDEGETAFFVVVNADKQSVLAPAHQELMGELAVLALVALLGGWLAWRMSGNALVVPAMALLEAIRELQKGRLEVRIAPPSRAAGDEFFHIAAGFNQMAESLQTQRDALQAQLAHSEAVQEKLQDAQRVGCIGYWQVDLATRQLWCSDEVYELLGVNRADFDGTADGFMGLVHPADRAVFRVASEAAMDAALPLDVEFRIITPAGQVRWMHQFGRGHAGAQAGQPSTHRSGVIQDITARKLAAQALSESEQRYAALFESAPVPMWVYDLASARFLNVNQTALESYGYSAQEFAAMTLFDIRPQVEHGRLRQQMISLQFSREVWQHRRKDGSVFPVTVFSHAIQYAGRAARFVVALDISAQIEAEGKVQDYLFTLQRAADAAQAITWHQRLDGMLQEIADQARGVIGAHQARVSLRPDPVGGPSLQALSLSEKHAPGHDGAEALPALAALEALVCESGRALHLTHAELEAHPCWRGPAPGADDAPALHGWLAVPLIGRDGANIGLLQLSDRYQGEFTQQDAYVALELAQLASIAIENTRLLEEVSRLNAGLEHKVAERTAELARQEALFRALAEQAPQTVWTASPDGAATYYNRAWFELMGGELRDWSGGQWLAAVHPEDVPAIKANWAAANADQAPYGGTRRLLARDGCYHTMAYRAAPVRDAQGQIAFWVGIDADVTELKAIEAALRLSNQELEAFSYSVSHDLRSPLNTIDGFSRLLAKQLAGAANDKVVHYLSRIQAGVAQMGQLIEDLLSLSQLTRAQLRSEALDISAMAQGILTEWQAGAPGRQVSVSVQEGLRAEADGRLLRLALTNLLANAWKFTSRTEGAEISVGRTQDAAGLPVFFVRDNGAGFDMAYADKLYAPFQRLHGASEFPGTGIGLAIVSRVIERHGGRLWAESTPGCGATFFFTLPRLRPLG